MQIKNLRNKIVIFVIAIILMVGLSLIKRLIGPENHIMINIEISTAKTIMIKGLPWASC